MRINCLDHCGLANNVARRFVRRFPHLDQHTDLEDAKQEAFIALMRAARTWDGVRAWMTYAAVSIERELLRWVKRDAVIPVPQCGGALPPIPAAMPGDLPEESRLDLRDGMLFLSDSDRDLLVRRYICRETRGEIARSACANEETIRRRELRALASLRSFMGVE